MHKILQSCSKENSTKFIHSIFSHETEIHYKSSTNKFHAKQTETLSDTSIHYVRNVIKKGKQEEEKKLLIEIVFSSQESGKARNTKESWTELWNRRYTGRIERKVSNRRLVRHRKWMRPKIRFSYQYNNEIETGWTSCCCFVLSGLSPLPLCTQVFAIRCYSFNGRVKRRD